MIAAGAIYGVIAVLVFRSTTDRALVRRNVNRILAHVMELGLFLESPGLVLRAQRELLIENIRLLRLVMLPGAILALLFVALFVPLDAIYGRATLPVGEASVVTVQMRDAAMPTVQLDAPEGVLVETPGVRVPRDRQISWRVRALRQGSGDFRFHVGNHVVTAGLFVRDPAIRSIEIRYPKVSWLGWFVLVSCVSAVVFGLTWKR